MDKCCSSKHFFFSHHTYLQTYYSLTNICSCWSHHIETLCFYHGLSKFIAEPQGSVQSLSPSWNLHWSHRPWMTIEFQSIYQSYRCLMCFCLICKFPLSPPSHIMDFLCILHNKQNGLQTVNAPWVYKEYQNTCITYQNYLRDNVEKDLTGNLI